MAKLIDMAIEFMFGALICASVFFTLLFTGMMIVDDFRKDLAHARGKDN